MSQIKAPHPGTSTPPAGTQVPSVHLVAPARFAECRFWLLLTALGEAEDGSAPLVPLQVEDERLALVVPPCAPETRLYADTAVSPPLLILTYPLRCLPGGDPEQRLPHDWAWQCCSTLEAWRPDILGIAVSDIFRGARHAIQRQLSDEVLESLQVRNLYWLIGETPLHSSLTAVNDLVRSRPQRNVQIRLP